MKNPEMSFTNLWGRTITFVNPDVYDWESTIERVNKKATVTLHLTYDSVVKTTPQQIPHKPSERELPQ